MAGPDNPDVAWAIADIQANLPRRQRALDYHDGKHPLNFATDKFHKTFGDLFQELADNLCDDVVNEPTDRLQIDGITGAAAAADVGEPDPVTGEMPEAPEDLIGMAAMAWWDDNRGPARAGSVHQNGFRSGDGFAMVWGDDNDVPRFYVQDPRQMAIRYSASMPDQPEVAAKCWREGKGYRLDLYYPDGGPGEKARIEHYYSRGYNASSGEKGIPSATAFIPWTVGQEGDDNHQPAVEEHDHGFPVFHFPNGELNTYGVSVLADVYPLQDALNKSICDMIVTGESYAAPKRWGTGIEVPRDPITGQEMPVFKDGQNLWWTKAKEAQFGQFSPAEMGAFLEEQRSWRLEIARKGGLPAHSVDLGGGGGNAPSGLSLLISEGKLIKRCKDRQRDWGGTWRELVAYALRWMGMEVTARDLDLVWGPVETRDEQALWELLLMKEGMGVPRKVLLAEAGYDPADISVWLADAGANAEERAAMEDAMAGGRVSVPGAGVGLLPAPPVPPNGAAQPSPVA